MAIFGGGGKKKKQQQPPSVDMQQLPQKVEAATDAAAAKQDHQKDDAMPAAGEHFSLDVPKWLKAIITGFWLSANGSREKSRLIFVAFAT